MKRHIAFLLVLVCTFSFIGCEKSEKSESLSRGECLVCDGKGTIECAMCKGSGRYGEKKVKCPGCHGVGETRCTICTDKAQNNDNDPEFNSNSNSNVVINPGINDNFDNNVGGNYPSSCVRCKNRGVITCTGCGGDGKIPKTQYAPDFGDGGGMYESYTTCHTCGGNKIIDCPNC